MKVRKWLASLVTAALFLQPISTASAEIAASHVYHNHMPNFWAWYDLAKYDSTAVGQPIRYSYDGEVIENKKNPPPNYIKNGAKVVPHDDLVSYYSHHAKVGAYQNWPANVANNLASKFKQGQIHVTMSASVINNVDSLNRLKNIPGYYDNPNWGKAWSDAYYKLKTTNGKPVLDMIHFTGHHSMGPLVGNEYMLKDLIYQNVTLAQPYFLGSNYKSSKGFFPTELGFSTRLIPALKKLGIEWSVIGNNHFSRTLKDYPKELWNNPGSDTLVSPPNRADWQNESSVGSWVEKPMFNEKQVTFNKFPFASTPHWVKYVDPESGVENRIVGIPVEQASSWEEGYQGKASGTFLKEFEGLTKQKQFFVLAHDGDNSQGRAGDEGTWMSGANFTYSEPGMNGIGIDEYLVGNKPAADDVAHVQDGSWIDTRDSSSDPQWHHWKLPFGIWKGQFANFNKSMKMDLAPAKSLKGIPDGMSVSMEYGYHYLERNFALLQASLNYAKTAEQIWLDSNPNHWQPKTALDKEVTHAGNQLNPWMLSYPVKGDESKNYAGGANPAELAWYFLIPAIDSGFGYYDENQDDNIKPSLSFNQSLFFSEPYVKTNLAKDKTGPSVWWPQRWPYNPGSANSDKSSGWTTNFYNNKFVIYTYAYDVNDVSGIKLRIRKHTKKTVDVKDNTFRVYDPESLKSKGVANITPANVGEWVDYPMNQRDLEPEMNGVPWQAGGPQDLYTTTLPAKKIGDLYYTYLDNYRDEIVDYYIEAIDSKGNISKTDIQQVYVGAGKYTAGGKAGYLEDTNGTVEGSEPFITRGMKRDNITVASMFKSDGKLISVTPEPTYDPGIIDVTPEPTTKPVVTPTPIVTTKPGTDTGTGSDTGSEGIPADTAIIYYKKGYDQANAHYKVGTTWTSLPGKPLENSEVAGYAKIMIPLNGTGQVEIAWNEGGTKWDSNGQKNYVFKEGVSTFDGGKITQSAPAGAKISGGTGSTTKPVTPPTSGGTTDPDSAVIYYKKGYDNPNAHYKVGTTWTSLPGKALDDAEVTGYAKIVIPLNGAGQVEIAWNEGGTKWDSNGQKNYIFKAGISTYDGGKIIDGAPAGATTPSPVTPEPATPEPSTPEPEKPTNTEDPGNIEEPAVVTPKPPVVTPPPIDTDLTAPIVDGIKQLTADQMTSLMAEDVPYIALASEEEGISFPYEVTQQWTAEDLILVKGDVSMGIPKDAMRAFLTMTSVDNDNVDSILIRIHVMTEEEKALLTPETSGGLTVSVAGSFISFEAAVLTKDGKLVPIKEFQQPVTISLMMDEASDPRWLGIYTISDQDEMIFVGGESVDGTIDVQISKSGDYGVFSYEKSYRDVKSTFWAHDVIKELSAKHIVSGVSATQFAPAQPVTRAELATFIVRALNLETTNEMSFRDVTADKWYAKYIITAADAGIVNGKGNKLFAPSDLVTRQEMISMLVRAQQYMTGEEAEETEANYADYDRINDWAVPFVQKAITLGIAKNTSANFNPRKTANRAEASQAIYNVLQSFKAE